MKVLILVFAAGCALNARAQLSPARAAARAGARAAINSHLETYGVASPGAFLALRAPDGALDHSPAARHLVILTAAMLKKHDLIDPLGEASREITQFANSHAVALIHETHDDMASPSELQRTITAIDSHQQRYGKLLHSPAALDAARAHAAKAITTRAADRANKIAHFIAQHTAAQTPSVEPPRSVFEFDSAWSRLSASISKTHFDAAEAAAEFSGATNSNRTSAAIMLMTRAKSLTDAEQIKRCIALINVLAGMSSDVQRRFFPIYISNIIKAHPELTLDAATSGIHG